MISGPSQSAKGQARTATGGDGRQRTRDEALLPRLAAVEGVDDDAGERGPEVMRLQRVAPRRAGLCVDGQRTNAHVPAVGARRHDATLPVERDAPDRPRVGPPSADHIAPIIADNHLPVRKPDSDTPKGSSE